MGPPGSSRRGAASTSGPPDVSARRGFLAALGSAAVVGCVTIRSEGGSTPASRPGTVDCADGVPPTDGNRRGRGDTWPALFYDARNTAHVEGRLGPQDCPSVRWTWEYDTDIEHGPGMYTSPVVSGGTVYLGDESVYYRDDAGATPDNNTVIAIDAVTGDERWRLDGHREATRNPALADGVLYVPSEGGFQAVDVERRRLLWDQALVDEPVFDEEERVGAPAVVHGVLYTGSRRGHLYAFDAETGAPSWRFDARGMREQRIGEDVFDEVAEARRRGSFVGSVAVDGGTVYAASHDSRLYAVDATTGEERWTYSFYGELGRGDFARAPAVHGDTVYMTTKSAGQTYALDARTGELRWHYDEMKYAPGVSPAVTEKTVFTTAGTSLENIYLVAIDRATGERRWRTWIGRANRGPAVDDHNVYISQGSILLACDRVTGEERWWFNMRGGGWSCPAIVNGSLFVAEFAGYVYGLW